MKKKTVKKKAVRRIQAKGASITVTRTVLGQSSEKVERIKIRPFITDTANVGVNYRMPIFMGEYRGNAQVGVMINMPCYVEEIVSAFRQVEKLAQELMDEQVKKCLADLRGKE